MAAAAVRGRPTHIGSSCSPLLGSASALPAAALMSRCMRCGDSSTSLVCGAARVGGARVRAGRGGARLRGWRAPRRGGPHLKLRDAGTAAVGADGHELDAERRDLVQRGLQVHVLAQVRVEHGRHAVLERRELGRALALRLLGLAGDAGRRRARDDFRRVATPRARRAGQAAPRGVPSTARRARSPAPRRAPADQPGAAGPPCARPARAWTPPGAWSC